MIKFFRNIRQKLLQENRFSKYLLYAIGEIVLVVIGILIALQINNWNDDRQNRAKTNRILKKVREELVLNIINSDEATYFYRTRESNIARVLQKDVTFDDYKDSNLAYLIWSNTTIEISDNVAKELDGFNELLSKEYDSLSLRIKEFYNSFKPTIDNLDKEMNHAVNDFDATLRTTTNWYYLSNNQQDLPEIAYDYFLNDTLYLNNVAYYESAGLQNHFSYNAIFNTAAKDLYVDLSEYLDLGIDSNLIKPIDQFEHFHGTYILEDPKRKDTLVIRAEENRLVYDWIDKNGMDTYSLYPSNVNEFIIGVRFAKMIRDENDEVSGFELTLGSRPKEIFRKIK